MSTSKQIELFRRLTDDRQFPAGQNVEQLRSQFANLTDRNASEWIERALDLPKRSDADEAASAVAPPF
jgi:hypothetical protein